MREECLICKAPFEYMTADEEMSCAVCGKKEKSKTRCENGHYVCNTCHTEGMDSIISIVTSHKSTDPIAILEEMMSMPFCHMHGPEHHVMVGAALLCAYKNAGGDIDLEKAFSQMYERGSQVPGGACGFWGACGAGISAGQFVSIITEATPLKEGEWGLSNRMTAKALGDIGAVGGPRCCKRDSYLSVLAAVDFVKENLGIVMEKTIPVCSRSSQNAHCIGVRCPFRKK